MQFFTVTLLLVAFAQSNAQSGGPEDNGNTDGGAIDQPPGGLGSGSGANQAADNTTLNDLELALAGVDNAEKYLDGLEKNLETDNFFGTLFASLGIILLSVTSVVKLDIPLSQLPEILALLGFVLRSDNNTLIKILGGAVLAVRGSLIMILGGNSPQARMIQSLLQRIGFEIPPNLGR